MAGKGKPRKTNSDRPAARPRTGFGPAKRKSCYLCRDHVVEVDYKDVDKLRRYTSGPGEDSLAPNDRRLPKASATGRRCDQAGPRDGAAPVHRAERRAVLEAEVLEQVLSRRFRRDGGSQPARLS